MVQSSIAVPEQTHTCGALAGSISEIPKLIYWVALPILRKNQYDQVEEFWVTIRETGTHEQSVTKEEKRYSSEKARFGLINQGVCVTLWVYGLHGLTRTTSLWIWALPSAA